MLRGDLLRFSLMLVFGHVWSGSKRKSGCISARRAWGCYSFPSSMSILPHCPSVFGSHQTLLSPMWTLRNKRPGATGRPLAGAQCFALEKQTQTCNAALALWTVSKQPQYPAFWGEKMKKLSVKTEALLETRTLSSALASSIKKFHLNFLDLSDSIRVKALKFGVKLFSLSRLRSP